MSRPDASVSAKSPLRAVGGTGAVVLAVIAMLLASCGSDPVGRSAGADSAGDRQPSSSIGTAVRATPGTTSTSTVPDLASHEIAYTIDAIHMVGADGSGSRLLAVTPGRPVALSWSPDGTRLATVTENGNPAAYVFDADGSGLVELAQLPPVELATIPEYLVYDLLVSREPQGRPGWSADGAKVAYPTGAGVAVVDLEGGAVHHVPEDTAVIGQPIEEIFEDYLSDVGWPVCFEAAAWSPVGNEIAFIAPCWLDAPSHVWVTAPDGIGLRRLTDRPIYGASSITWSADGEQLAFAALPPSLDDWEDTDLYVVDAAGGNLRRLTTGSDRDSLPSWSPVGSRLAFHRWHRSDTSAERPRIYVVDGDGGDPVPVSGVASELPFFAWSPDGHHLSYAGPDPLSEIQYSNALWVVGAEGGEPTKITGDLQRDLAHAWRP